MIILISALIALLSVGAVQDDVFETSAGELHVTHVVHGSLMLEIGGTVIHVDPYARGDYSNLPKADLILITHHHGDHLNPDLIRKLLKESTQVIGTATAAKQYEGMMVMNNGMRRTFGDIVIEAVPAYNIIRTRKGGEPFHPEGMGNGYVLTFGDTRVYIAGDTEHIPEMEHLKDIDIAFLPCNLPYTMTPEELAAAAKAVNPRICYAYHLGDTDVEKIRQQFAALQGIELRIARETAGR
jgi:L-ascorbate metabolism protein UlaG (beta-lactamase superfamily)